MSYYNIDVSQFGSKAPLVQWYVDAIELHAELDEKIGDAAGSGTSFMRSVAERKTDAVAIAKAFIEQLNGLDSETRAVVMHQVSSNGDLRKNLRTYVQENAPKETEKTESDEQINIWWAERSAAQKNAVAFYGAFTSGSLTAEEIALLPEPPKGARGAAPGARGAMGRQIPFKSIAWTITPKNGEPEAVGVKTNAQAAKLAGVKTSELRQAVEAAYPDSTPTPFTVTFPNGVTVKGEAQTVEVAETDKPEVDPAEVDDFDVDDLDEDDDDDLFDDDDDDEDEDDD